MDKRVIFAVAGSGKTTRLVEELDGGRRCLFFTFTDENVFNLRKKILERYDKIPANVSVMTYFTFLHSFCFRPAAGLKTKTRGLSFRDPPQYGQFNQKQDGYYMDSGRRLYYNRLAKFIMLRGLVNEARARIEQFYDVVCVDEVQDLAGNDFNLLLELMAAKVSILLVGDFRQHTYDTSRDGAVNTNLHSNFKTYTKRFRDAGVVVDTTSLAASRRCSPAVCDFITRKLNIPISTMSDRAAAVLTVHSQTGADNLWMRSDVVKLFYQEHSKYGCHSQNWGASKGEDHYDEVCVVLNKTTLAHHQNETLSILKPATLNKFYVALSRSRGNVYLVAHKYFDQYKVCL